MFLSDTGIVLRKGESGDKFLIYVLFLKQLGLKNVLLRKSRKPGKASSMLDLFDVCEFKLQQKDESAPAFLQDFEPTKSFSRISRNYSALEAASLLCRFYELNLLHMEFFGNAWDLLTTAISALEEKPAPEVTLLKTLFIFARSEGYAVASEWLARQPSDSAEEIRQLLHQPVGKIQTDKKTVKLWIQDLLLYFEHHTELLPPSPAA